MRPAFIRDPDLLVCPFVLKTGQLKEWRRKYFDGVWADQYSSYAYEFILESAHFYPAATYRYFKQRQMELLGFSVPIVRCFAHRPVLNLAFDGNIYESPDTWEEIFVRSKDQESFFHGYVRPTTSQNQMIRKIIAQQPPELAAGALDLIGSYNALVLHLSEVDNQGKLLIKSPEGVLRIGGVEFDIRGLVHLTGKDFPINFPQKVENIPVNRKCAQIHFLHGAMFSAPAGSKVASYVVRFSNGHSEEVPIVYGKDVKTRWFDARQKSELENPRPAWVT
ncbi:MAG: hypothetical protein HY694_05610, partial [Deltaproteobacteria bacterium]|nr:hypothetical protein [Deltaproteobacteria bacterium]